MREPLKDKTKLAKLYELERRGDINSEMDKDDKHRIFYKDNTPLTDEELDDLWTEYIFTKNLNSIMKNKSIDYIQ